MAVSTSRLEAFSDGVFAIAITLLVLEISVPTGRGNDLWQALGEQWPSYAGFVLSFFTIGIIWVNHHAAFDWVARTDRSLLFLNLLLLMAVAFIPFTTALMADYLREARGQDVAAAVYSASLLLMSLSFAETTRYVHAHPALLKPSTTEPGAAWRRQRRNLAGHFAYAVAVGLAFVNVYVSVGICALVAVSYIPAGATQRFES